MRAQDARRRKRPIATYLSAPAILCLATENHAACPADPPTRLGQTSGAGSMGTRVALGPTREFQASSKLVGCVASRPAGAGARDGADMLVPAKCSAGTSVRGTARRRGHRRIT